VKEVRNQGDDYVNKNKEKTQPKKKDDSFRLGFILYILY
jgi:hypothetical protein